METDVDSRFHASPLEISGGAGIDGRTGPVVVVIEGWRRWHEGC